MPLSLLACIMYSCYDIAMCNIKKKTFNFRLTFRKSVCYATFDFKYIGSIITHKMISNIKEDILRPMSLYNYPHHLQLL